MPLVEQRPSPDKTQLRAALRAARRARTPEQREQDARALAAAALAAPPLAELGPGAVVAAYASAPAEPGTGPLRAALRAAGLVVLLPVVAPVPGPLGWVVDGGPDDGDRADGDPDLLGRADAVLLPALAVDGRGVRLGQGGGHYDRTLARPLPRRPPLVAVVHAEEVLPAGALPEQAHDVRVGAALTPAGWVALLPQGPPPVG